jgi:glutathione S-transferase
VRLYYSPGACSLSPHFVAREAGLPIELVRVDTRTHRFADGRDFHEAHPRGYVPVLELDDGSRLREGAAIVQFLADREVLNQQCCKIGKVLAELEPHLGERSFLTTPYFSVADAYAFTIARWCGLLEVMIDLDPYRHVRAYMPRIADRDGVREALIAEGLDS